ncbi:MFS transporter [Klebsiella sp. BIGb0407]|uniref:MFS transporter n=1 Tax=Klebsiella sp. BIGb0407 TaxID=2940603 RepID=UPI0021695C6A|nr:MFS transporter [Klebsiella sp. BIGb0407]MCS3432798.1 putative MFS family arabinose efflux permease [Klebsiella sp. BIGb0407]
MSTSPSAATETVVRHSWLAVSAVGLAIFSVVTTELLPVGLLTPIAEELNITSGTAGLMVSFPALLAAFFSPLVVLLSGGTDRRRILCALLGLLVAANLASALAPSWGWMLVARILVGFCIGGIWAIASSLAVRLVRPAAVGLATSIIFGGVAAASVLGVPLGALIGDLIGWRWAFGCMALFSAAVLVMHLLFIPSLPVKGSARVRHFVEQLANRKLQIAMLLTLLLVSGHFAAFTFVRPLLVSVSGFDVQWLGVLLFGYGIAGMTGNFLTGMVAMRRTTLTLATIALGLLLTPVLFLTVGNFPTGGAAVLLLWGLSYGGISVGLMTWVMKAESRMLEIATALYVGVFNISIGLGSWAGGQLFDSFGLLSNLWFASGCAACALLLISNVAYRHKAAGTPVRN